MSDNEEKIDTREEAPLRRRDGEDEDERKAAVEEEKKRRKEMLEKRKEEMKRKNERRAEEKRREEDEEPTRRKDDDRDRKKRIDRDDDEDDSETKKKSNAKDKVKKKPIREVNLLISLFCSLLFTVLTFPLPPPPLYNIFIFYYIFLNKYHAKSFHFSSKLSLKGPCAKCGVFLE